MKLNKKLIGALLAVVLVASCGIFAVSALEDAWPCCDNYRGTATEVLEHWISGEDCEAHVRTYCPECGTIFDDYVGIWCPCTHDDYN